MKNIVTLAGLALLGLLGGCAAEYHPKNASGGFSETSLAPDLWRVRFEHTYYTPKRQVEDFALLRSAELTLRQGYTHFTLSDPGSAEQILKGAQVTPSPPGPEVVVHMLPKASANTVALYDARAVCDKLGSWYQERCR